jgi:hypothetical protein
LPHLNRQTTSAMVLRLLEDLLDNTSRCMPWKWLEPTNQAFDNAFQSNYP